MKSQKEYAEEFCNELRGEDHSDVSSNVCHTLCVKSFIAGMNKQLEMLGNNKFDKVELSLVYHTFDAVLDDMKHHEDDLIKDIGPMALSNTKTAFNEVMRKMKVFSHEDK